DGLRLFFSIAEAMTTGMTAAAQAAGKQQDRAELTSVACLMMLERVNYLISAEVQLPENEMADRIADIMFAAFGLNVPRRRQHDRGGRARGGRDGSGAQDRAGHRAAARRGGAHAGTG